MAIIINLLQKCWKSSIRSDDYRFMVNNELGELYIYDECGNLNSRKPVVEVVDMKNIFNF